MNTQTTTTVKPFYEKTVKKDTRTQDRIEDDRQRKQGFFVNDRCWLTGFKYQKK